MMFKGWAQTDKRTCALIRLTIPSGQVDSLCMILFAIPSSHSTQNSGYLE